MNNPRDKRVLIRWMFYSLGWLLLLGSSFIIDSVLRVQFWANLILPENQMACTLLMLLTRLYLLLTGILCWFASYGMKRNKRWAQPVGICTSSMLLLGFPWLTLVGALAIHVLVATSGAATSAADLSGCPIPATPTTDFWLSKRKSKAQPIVFFILWSAALPLTGLFSVYAQRAGMPEDRSGLLFLLWFFLFVFIHTVIHEAGHAIAAWAVGFKVKIISFGPLTFWRDHSGVRFRFDLGKTFESGGYTGATPVSDVNLRMNQIAVVAAGPAFNALTCLVCLAIFFSLPGTPWERWWWIFGYNAIVAGTFAVLNLIPLGYCDGTMLLHLIAWTGPGRLLLFHMRANQLAAEAEALHGRAAFDKEIELKEALLQRAMTFGKDNAFLIAAAHQSLGTSNANLGDWPAAELHFFKCIECHAELAANPSLAANAWSGLHLTSIRRQQVAAVGPAYASVVRIVSAKKNGPAQAQDVTADFALLAQAHVRNGSFDAALCEVEQGIKALSAHAGDSARRAHFLRSEALCRFGLGQIDAGLAAAQAAAEVLRSHEIPPARRNLAWEDLADLGHHLWSAGQSTIAIELMREGIGGLEDGGAALVAAMYRIRLAGVLRHMGRLEEARLALPEYDALTRTPRCDLLTERVELELSLGHPEIAVTEGRALVSRWREHPCAPPPEIACAEALLARACLAAGDMATAESLAVQASDVLGPWQHPDAASCIVTIALARAHSADENGEAAIAAAFDLIEGAPLLNAAEKARRKAAELARIQQYSPAAHG